MPRKLTHLLYWRNNNIIIIITIISISCSVTFNVMSADSQQISQYSPQNSVHKTPIYLIQSPFPNYLLALTPMLKPPRLNSYLGFKTRTTYHLLSLTTQLIVNSEPQYNLREHSGWLWITLDWGPRACEIAAKFGSGMPGIMLFRHVSSVIRPPGVCSWVGTESSRKRGRHLGEKG